MVSMATAEASPMRFEPILPRVKNTAIPVAMAIIWKIMVFASHLIWAGRLAKSAMTQIERIAENAVAATKALRIHPAGSSSRRSKSGVKNTPPISKTAIMR